MKEFSEHNDDYNYLLCVIDCYFKYAWCEKLKTKTGQKQQELLKRYLITVELQMNFSLIWVNNSIAKKSEIF